VQWGFIDSEGKVLIQPEWDSVDLSATVLNHFVTFNEGLCAVRKDGKWGYIDPTGKVVISNQFESVSPFVEGMARIRLGNLTGYIDKGGHYVINPQFSQAGDFHEGMALARGDGGWGFINKSGTFAIPARFQRADLNGFSGGLAAVCTEGKCGYIDRSGVFVIQPQFQNAGTFSEGMAEVQLNGKYGYINTSGKFVINPQFDQTTMFSGGVAAVSIAGRQGTIDKQGQYVVNPGQYVINPGQQSFPLTEGDVLVGATSDGIGLITRAGQWLMKPTKSLAGTGPIYGNVFMGAIGNQPQLVPIAKSGKVLAGPYKGAQLDSLAEDIANENRAMQSIRAITAAQTSYSALYAEQGFAASLDKLGPPVGSPPDKDHAGFIDAILAGGTKDGYQFTVSIPAGTSTGGTNFNYFLVARPAAGHFGKALCADSSGSVRYAEAGASCTTASPQLVGD